jgi:hypothetical protein
MTEAIASNDWDQSKGKLMLEEFRERDLASGAVAVEPVEAAVSGRTGFCRLPGGGLPTVAQPPFPRSTKEKGPTWARFSGRD